MLTENTLLQTTHWMKKRPFIVYVYIKVTNQFDTSVSVIDGSDVAQTAQWRKTNDNSQYEEGRIVLQGYDKCLGVQTLPSGKLKLQAKPCLETVEHSVPVPLRNTLPLWKKRNKLKSLERKIYEREKRK